MKLNKLATGASALWAVAAIPAFAADHAEAPGTQADSAADIADLYAWHTSDGTLVGVITFASSEASADATYDPDVLYGLHIDTDFDHVSDHDVWVRFGQNGAGAWGVQVVGLPGADDTVVGAVEETLDAGDGLRVYAGLRDDPFFFDATGFFDTLSTGTLMFDANRDAFAGRNVTAIVVEADVETLGATAFQVWATTGRL